MRKLILPSVALAGLLALGACTDPYSPGQRAAGGGLLGAGAGAAIGGLAGGGNGALAGGLLGGAAGAAGGALTTPERPRPYHGSGNYPPPSYQGGYSSRTY